jgi:hypothetical protein
MDRTIILSVISDSGGSLAITSWSRGWWKRYRAEPEPERSEGGQGGVGLIGYGTASRRDDAAQGLRPLFTRRSGEHRPCNCQGQEASGQPVLAGERAVTADTAFRMSATTGTSAEMWRPGPSRRCRARPVALRGRKG